MTLRRRTPGRGEPEERELTRRVLQGDEEAFEGFFEGHFPVLYRFALARLRDPDLARDVVQSALCKALANLRGFRGETSLAGWLFTICRHEISGHFRRLGRSPTAVELFEETAPGPGFEAFATTGGDPEQELGRKQLAGLVHDALDRLPPRYGLALEWKYVEGLSVAQIAERLEVGPKAAESVLSRARAAFREAFSSLGRQAARWREVSRERRPTAAHSRRGRDGAGR